MAALETPEVEIGAKAPDFALPGTDGQTHRLADAAGSNGLLVIFMCNHCPYVQKQLDRIIETAKALQAMDIGVVAISANDAEHYPEDSFDNMRKLARDKSFPFPYLHDESQEVAKAYGAVCTPDFFGYNANLELQYRGRLDTSWMDMVEDGRRELLEAMRQIAESGQGPQQQNPSVGCSIKWKDGADRAAS